MHRFLVRPSLAGEPPSRRDWLRIGIPALLAASARPGLAGPLARAKSVLVVFTSGGQSQLETWDPKPNAPVEVRGAFGTIPTALPGVRFCEHLPQLAKLADRFTLLRSMTHDDLDHGSACYLALTGQFHPRKSSNPPPAPTDFPALGAVLHRVRPTDRFPHSAFHVNGPLLAPIEASPGQYGGFLGHGYDPIELGDVSAGAAVLDGLSLPPDVSRDRLRARKSLAAALDSGALPVAGHADLLRKAYELIDSPRVRTAFELGKEPSKVRDRYGRYRAGQACLLARRLVEAGVPWVTAFFNHTIRGQDHHPDQTDEYGWDTHNDIFEAMREHLLPRFDHSFSTLLDDLDDRGLLKETLVVCMGEFGRAPLVAREKNFAGTTPGRKHWARCYTIVLAGAGVRRGAVYGASDRHAAYPQSQPVTPGDLAATMFGALGIPADTHYTDLADRPQRMTTGEPVAGLFG
ncbi:MAG TPA: DUF1501 domain-containing protein [Fimbriiglobus sp.]|nr:DUF1501 domain-containing protein [Fimbriiglobus sp.]